MAQILFSDRDFVDMTGALLHPPSRATVENCIISKPFFIERVSKGIRKQEVFYEFSYNQCFGEGSLKLRESPLLSHLYLLALCVNLCVE